MSKNNEFNESYANQVNEIINTLELESETDKSILKSRFLSEVVQYEERRNKTKKYYDIFRFIVTTGSILLPAILSLGQMDPAKLPKHFDQWTYWASWTISLMVTASNGFLQLFSLDKNYFEYALTTEQLKTEGWQYFQLSGKYEDDESHKDAYKSFSKSIENIKRKQVEKEFSGKGDVNKNKKEKKFDFQKELMNNLPDHLKPPIDIEKGKSNELDNLLTDKLDKMNNLMKLLEDKNKNTENVKDIITESINEQISEKVNEQISENINEKVNEKVNKIESNKT
jgi:hypothetical protein